MKGHNAFATIKEADKVNHSQAMKMSIKEFY